MYTDYLFFTSFFKLTSTFNIDIFISFYFNINRIKNNYFGKKKIIDNASCLSYNNKYYIPINLATGEAVNFQKGTKCILIIDYDGEYIGEIEEHYYKMLELENHNSVIKKESESTDSKLEKEHHKYIPPKNHPWRKNMMLNH